MPASTLETILVAMFTAVVHVATVAKLGCTTVVRTDSGLAGSFTLVISARQLVGAHCYLEHSEV